MRHCRRMSSSSRWRSWLKSRSREAERRFRVSTGDGAFWPRPRRIGLRDRRRADAPVLAVDTEVRAEFLADTNLGSGGGRVWRAAVHLGHTLLINSLASHRHADCARDCRLHLRALPQSPEARARISDGAA